METIVAVAVLSVGLLAMAGLMARMLSTTYRSGYMSIATQLASEKLEDLNRFPADSPYISAAGGSLSSDVTATVTSGGETVSVPYYDDVRFSATGGEVSQVKTDATDPTKYDIITHQPDGTILEQQDQDSIPNGNGMMRFNRRWIVEPDQPTTGVRRITVLVTLENPIDTPVTAQMSMVRP